MEVVSVRFRSGTRTYYFDPRGIAVRPGQGVIVQTAQGLEYVTCVQGNHGIDERLAVLPLRPVVRLANDTDRHTLEQNSLREKEAFTVCLGKIAQRGLDMHLVRVECSFEASKLMFFFTSDGRVDFRDLVRDLASAFHSRIELRQIGVRDEARLLGGIGICGRPFCCAQFLDDFIPVSIKMAKTQNLSLNPVKIFGSCGRLMCCLKYEQDAYEDAARRMPRCDSFVLTPDGPGTITAVDLLRECVTVRLDDAPDGQRHYHACELRVLRSGKGSREGIVIPDERPARFTPAMREPEELRTAAQEALEALYVPEQESAPDERAPRSRRGGRNHRRGERPTGERPAEERPNADKPRPGKLDLAKPRPEKRAPKSAPDKSGAPKSAAAETGGEGAKPPRPRNNNRRGGWRSHRGGRGGQGSGNSGASGNPGAE